MEDQGTRVVAFNCLKGDFRDDGAFLGKGQRRKPPQSAAWKLEMRKKKSQSKGSVVVQEVTQRESGSAHGFVFQGTASEGRETSVRA